MTLANVYFNIVPLIVAMAVPLIGAMVYVGNRKNIVGKAWFFSCIFASAWSIFFFLIINSSSRGESLILRIFLDASAILVMFFWFRFVVIFLEIKDKRIMQYALVITAFMLLLNLSPGFIKDMVPKYIFSYYVDAGWGYYVFALYFLLLASAGLAFLYNIGHRSEGIKAIQIKNVFWSSLVGMVGGGSAFLLSFNIPFPPYLFILFAGLPLITARGILKYKLFNVQAIATEIFILAIWVFLTARLALSATQQDIIINAISLVSVILFGILVIRSMHREVAQREQIEDLANRLKSVNNILGHDVKAVLGKNKGLFSEMVEGAFGPISDSLKTMIQRLSDDTGKVLTMIMTILESGHEIRLDVGEFDFKAAVLEVISDVKPDVDQKGLSIKSIIDETQDYKIIADRNQLVVHVIRNLIENAINYTPKGYIEVRLLKQNPMSIILSVKDSGVGITVEDKLRLFKEGGHGVDSIKVNVHSTGYGLFIAKKIVEGHGGKIWAESEGKDKGSTFFVELPAKGPAGKNSPSLSRI